MMLCSDEIFWGKMPLVVMKFVGAKYGNKNVKIILVKKCFYVVMKYIGGKSEQRTYPQSITLLICFGSLSCCISLASFKNAVNESL